jgi:hypothetical protein
MIAVRNSEGDNVKAALEDAFTRWRDDVGQQPGVEWTSADTMMLAGEAAGAPIASPILLWRIAPELAARMVANQLILIGLIRGSLWEDLFQAHGITRDIDEDGGWQLRRGEALVTFTRVEVAKVTAGATFSGISPSSVADAVAAELSRQLAQSPARRAAGPR